MKKIALVMDGWKHYFTYAWPAGILQRIKETGEDGLELIEVLKNG